MTTRSTIDRWATYRANPAQHWTKGEWKAWHYDAMKQLQDERQAKKTK